MSVEIRNKRIEEFDSLLLPFLKGKRGIRVEFHSAIKTLERVAKEKNRAVEVEPFLRFLRGVPKDVSTVIHAYPLLTEIAYRAAQIIENPADDRNRALYGTALHNLETRLNPRPRSWPRLKVGGFLGLSNLSMYTAVGSLIAHAFIAPAFCLAILFVSMAAAIATGVKARSFAFDHQMQKMYQGIDMPLLQALGKAPSLSAKPALTPTTTLEMQIAVLNIPAIHPVLFEILKGREKEEEKVADLERAIKALEGAMLEKGIQGIGEFSNLVKAFKEAKICAPSHSFPLLSELAYRTAFEIKNVGQEAFPQNSDRILEIFDKMREYAQGSHALMWVKVITAGVGALSLLGIAIGALGAVGICSGVGFLPGLALVTLSVTILAFAAAGYRFMPRYCAEDRNRYHSIEKNGQKVHDRIEAAKIAKDHSFFPSLERRNRPASKEPAESTLLSTPSAKLT